MSSLPFQRYERRIVWNVPRSHRGQRRPRKSRPEKAGVKRGVRCPDAFRCRDVLGGFDPTLPGCAILDMYLPKLNGFELQQKIAAIAPNCPVVFLTGRGDIHMGVEEMEEGLSIFSPSRFTRKSSWPHLLRPRRGWQRG